MWGKIGTNHLTQFADVENTLADVQDRQVVPRIWQKDYSVWKDDPFEIGDRLGWLDLTNTMLPQVADLKDFANQIKDLGYTHVVLLAMGGSSLAPEVIRQTFGNAPGYPELIVLDSTLPKRILEVANQVDLAHTLFLLSSKSGSSIESLSLYQHFRRKVDILLGSTTAGKNFVAITDLGTPLARLAQDQGFRNVFFAQSDVGGRYSALSHFGLVPAALIGVDLEKLLLRATSMRATCSPAVHISENPGATLGGIIGSLALKGRDKLTLLTSPSIVRFGLWAEQLIAESTGKDGKGIVPVIGEPLLEVESFGRDRVFVYLRVEDDSNLELDAFIQEIQSSGQPVLRLDLADVYDVGAEFFRWEMATAIAGSVMGIHPFNQPDVQATKDTTDGLLAQYQISGRLEEVEASNSLDELLSQATTGDYLVILAYVHENPEIERALAAIRKRVTKEYKIATCLGYGPRYLHSTGQLHKGGANTGLFLEITESVDHDLPVPGQIYSFGVLSNAQARGDLKALQTSGRRTAKLTKEQVLALNIG
ncbi:MAG: glucose-6-phosphate isomerase [SAR202 cluster bacterium Io17-Chloro-G3]|nr:MAG: glucose-6-phosphate isomerase [SAR202 cluster bacterium Io17-Chloro-G3]